MKPTDRTEEDQASSQEDKFKELAPDEAAAVEKDGESSDNDKSPGK